MCEMALLPIVSKVRLKFERRATLSITLFNPLDLLEIGDEQGCMVSGRAYMNRELALKIALALVGVLFLGLVYPLAIFMRQEPALSMMLSLYVTLGVFLLLAIRNPSANRSLIAFTAWSSFAHAAVMGTQALRNMISRGELIGVAILVISIEKRPWSHAFPRPSDPGIVALCRLIGSNPETLPRSSSLECAQGLRRLELLPAFPTIRPSRLGISSRE